MADDAETQRYRLFEAVSHVLESAACDRPTVLILDDLQWADRPTLLLLRQIMRGLIEPGPASAPIT